MIRAHAKFRLWRHDVEDQSDTAGMMQQSEILSFDSEIWWWEVDMTAIEDRQAIRVAVQDYLDGMIYGQDDKLRRAMHPLCMQAGHFNGQYEFFTREEFIASLKSAEPLPAGTPYVADTISIDMAGDTAVAKVYNECLGTTFTDYLSLIRHEGRWQIVMKSFFDHAHEA
jgi:hypothetical protein